MDPGAGAGACVRDALCRGVVRSSLTGWGVVSGTGGMQSGVRRNAGGIVAGRRSNQKGTGPSVEQRGVSGRSQVGWLGCRTGRGGGREDAPWGGARRPWAPVMGRPRRARRPRRPRYWAKEGWRGRGGVQEKPGSQARPVSVQAAAGGGVGAVARVVVRFSVRRERGGKRNREAQQQRGVLAYVKEEGERKVRAPKWQVSPGGGQCEVSVKGGGCE